MAKEWIIHSIRSIFKTSCLRPVFIFPVSDDDMLADPGERESDTDHKDSKLPEHSISDSTAKGSAQCRCYMYSK